MNDDKKNRTLSLKRTFDASVTLVWEAWTQPEHIAAWWAPKGMETKIIEHSFIVGGKWKYVMDMPDGSAFISQGVYQLIDDLNEIYTTAEFIPMTEEVEIQYLFESVGDKTNFIFNCIHPTEEYCKQQQQMGFFNGWGATFERLSKYLAEQINP